MKTLTDFYESHTGKVSDKWALYLREYDRLFAQYREQTISMLEIGVQNGGSLEIWSKYFPHAKKFVGCDINPDCSKLTYADPRIAIIVGDATTPETQAKVLAQSPAFDLIIEDGAHTSSDIVKAFARYFPALKPGGLFVAEDLHCSYWQEYEGGIFHPYSSITFFKYLADIVNHEHWGGVKSRVELIAGFNRSLNINFDESLLSNISSVEFINSICVVRKRDVVANCLGARVIAGAQELVVAGHLSMAGKKLESPIQSTNEWSNLAKPPAESYQDLIEKINQTQALLAQARNEVDAIQNSKTWRYTRPFREMVSIARHVVSALLSIKTKARMYGGYSRLIRKVILLMRSEGVHSIMRTSGLKSPIKVSTSTGKWVDRNDYQTWIKLHDTLDSQEIERIQTDIASFDVYPKISVVMPVYNAPLDYLKQAIESVQAQLYQHWELCIADDASTEVGVRPMLKSFAKSDSRIKMIFREQNGHISLASNSALELASGDFVALLDNDDLLSRHALYHVATTVRCI